MQALWQDSYLSGDNTAYLEKLDEAPLENYSSKQGQQFQEKVIDLIAAYRSVGHLQANLDPLGLYKGIDNPTLKLDYYGFTEADLNTVFDVGSFSALQKSSASLREIYETLRKVYCGSIGIEYMHILQQAEVSWIQKRMEQDWSRFSPTSEQKQRILDGLIAADGLEKYLGFKYVGQKRFSLEGGDSLIPMLDELIKRGAENGIKEIVIGMAHRGRMNVLVNLLGKAPEKIFAGFEGKGIDETSSGDVKYHLGFSSNIKVNGSQVHLALAFNPSHLEIVSPVVQGSVRSRQRRRKDIERSLVMPIQIHGDAAFAGQGVVMETFATSQTRWFWVGGSVHIVINNQVGFTISNPQDARSGLYCTDVAKMVQAPVLHVNGNDPQAIFFAAQLAADYRSLFKKDIVIDMVCYRRHGHNEADEPSATQPVMYKIIKSMPAPCTLYANQLVSEGVIDADAEQQKADAYRKKLDEGKTVIELIPKGEGYEYANAWEPFLDKDWTLPAKTAVSLNKVKEIAKKIEVLPENFSVQPQVKKMLEARQKMTEGELPLNWGYAETLAYATLLEEGYPIRLCGQDACRGTFAHRHAVLHDQETDAIYIPLSHISDHQAQINIVDSLLSEEAVLAFEYGYASAEPNNLVIWEAQFGDFANGAQVVIDQFISSGEQKWGRLCGLVMLLPHGYEGQGPEHSSARLERYLQLCAEHNMQVCVPSTPAQIFHLLRRQMIRPYRKPLIVMTPKSLLRAELAVSSLEDITQGEFNLVIPDSDIKELKEFKKVNRVILCSGKVYYDLLKKRREQKLNHIAIIRVEQLYPFPTDALKEILKPYKHVKTIIWCQEEPKNQGAWYSTQHHLHACLESTQTLSYAGRDAAAAPAVGYASVHLKQQDMLVNQALGGSI
jgi:2-oxoglutarate dehydrogenase E1 component